MPCFEYDEAQTAYLASRDKRMAEAIERIGPIRRAVTPDLFSALVYSIIGQQISTKAHVTIWKRMLESYGEITPRRLADAPAEEIQAFGLSFRKVDYIKGAAQAVLSGALDVDGLQKMDDAAVVQTLCALKGVGEWTAEMLMIFSLQRPDVLSWGDFGIRRGVRMLYRHKELDRARFERYRKRFSPCGSVASLYLWAIAGGALPELNDPAEPGKK